MSQRQINIGFLGGGMMSQVGHLPFYAKDTRVNLFGIAEERPSLQEALGEQYGRDRIYSNRQALLACSDLDAVVLSSPRPATGPLSLEVLQSGKHLLAEKPMAHTVEQAASLVDASAKSELIYMVGYMKLYDPGIRAAKNFFDDVMSSKMLGDLISARFYSYSKSYAVRVPQHTRPQESRSERYPIWPTYPEWLNEDYRDHYAWFLNAISHNVNLMQHFVSGLEVTQTNICNGSSVTTLFEANGIPVILDVGKTSAGRWVEGAEFNFEAGRMGIVIPSPMSNEEVAKVFVDDPSRNWIKHSLPTGAGWCFEMQAKAYVDVLSGDKSSFLSPGESALSDMRLIENIWKEFRG